MKDFGAEGCSLDEGEAWRNFGGLSLEEAYQVFADNVVSRMEDFVWMGYEAFRYYFPVLDRYLRSIDPKSADYAEDLYEKSLAGVIAAQILRRKESGEIEPEFAGEIRELSKFLLVNGEQYAAPGKWLRSFERAWRGVIEAL